MNKFILAKLFVDFTGYNPACGVCAMLHGGYVLWSSQNAITVSKQLEFKQQKQLKTPCNGSTEWRYQ